jgi:hypothetical protein
MTECWYLCFDDDQHEDRYVLRPSISEVNEAIRAAPDAFTRLYYSPDGIKRELVQEWGDGVSAQ